MFGIAEDGKLDLAKAAVTVYAGKYFAVSSHDMYPDIILDLRDKPRERIRRWITLFGTIYEKGFPEGFNLMPQGGTSTSVRAFLI